MGGGASSEKYESAAHTRERRGSSILGKVVNADKGVGSRNCFSRTEVSDFVPGFVSSCKSLFRGLSTNTVFSATCAFGMLQVGRGLMP